MCLPWEVKLFRGPGEELLPLRNNRPPVYPACRKRQLKEATFPGPGLGLLMELPGGD